MGCYLLSSIIFVLIMLNLKINYSFMFTIFFIATLFYQVKIFKVNNSSSCLRAFKINNFSGLFIFLSLFLLTIEI